jgi:uncharacterized protein (AIM24 family)
MIGDTGEMAFTGTSSAGGGITGSVKETVTSETTPIMEAEGTGTRYVANRSKKVQILELDAGDSISVNGNDILAFEASGDYEINTVGGLSEAASGGLTNVSLTGPGAVASSTRGDPLVLTPPVVADPGATVAWSGGLSSSLGTNKTIEIGQTSSGTIHSPARRGSSSSSPTRSDCNPDWEPERVTAAPRSLPPTSVRRPTV